MSEELDNNNFEDVYDDVDSSPLFWSMKLSAGDSQEIEQPAIPGYIVHITNACFGAKLNPKSRTVVTVNPTPEDGDTSLEAPICVLRAGAHENHPLDLLFNESATLSLKGKQISNVYLTGYIQPPVQGVEDIMDPEMEDLTEAEIEEALKAQRTQQMELDDEEEEPQLVEEEEEVVEPPTKKQKTNKGPKNTKESDKKAKSPSEKKRKSPKQKAVEEEDKKEEVVEKKEKKGKKKKSKMQNIGNGIRYRDMKVGDGKQIANGDKVSVYYVGQTDDRKVFDKAISGKGFEFNYGKGDVIKGWDIGLKGARVGGKRKLIIPPKMAYGSNGSPPTIPPNATLTFTIEIKSAN